MKAFLPGALLLAASQLLCQQSQLPSKDPQVVGGKFVWFTLNEDSESISRVLGQPAQVAEFGPGYLSLQFQVDSADKHDFSHVLVVRRADRKLISITRSFDEPRSVDALFPADASSTEFWPDTRSPKYSVRVRKLSGERFLVAMGVAQPGDTTTQLMLIHRSALGAFMPWLEARAGLR